MTLMNPGLQEKLLSKRNAQPASQPERKTLQFPVSALRLYARGKPRFRDALCC